MKKKAIIFGGSSGIGFFFTKELINRGYNVTVISSDIVKLKKAKKIIKQEMSSNIDIYELDLLNQKKFKNF